MIVFAHSSALVPRYDLTEPDPLPADAIIVVSVLARVEVVSALSRKAVERAVSPTALRVIVGDFEAEWRSDWSVLSIAVDPVVERAAAVSAVHRLRTLDAIQLASALSARDAEPACRTFVALDRRLRDAAAVERFDVLPLG